MNQVRKLTFFCKQIFSLNCKLRKPQMHEILIVFKFYALSLNITYVNLMYLESYRIVWFRGVVVITFASHAKGPQFDPGRNHFGSVWPRRRQVMSRTPTARRPGQSVKGSVAERSKALV